MNFMKTDYELKRSKRKTLSLTVTKDLKVSVNAPVGCPQKTIDDFVLSHEKWINEHIEKQKSRLSLEKTLDEKRVSELRALAAAELPRRVEYYSEKMGLYPASVKITSADSVRAAVKIQYAFHTGLCFIRRKPLITLLCTSLRTLRKRTIRQGFTPSWKSICPITGRGKNCSKKHRSFDLQGFGIFILH